jgi:hypothetical protein
LEEFILEALKLPALSCRALNKPRSILRDALIYVQAEIAGFAVHNGLFGITRKFADSVIEKCCLHSGIELQPIPHCENFFNHRDVLIEKQNRLDIDKETIKALKFLKMIGNHGLHGFDEADDEEARVQRIMAKAQFLSKLQLALKCVLRKSRAVDVAFQALSSAPMLLAPSDVDTENMKTVLELEKFECK